MARQSKVRCSNQEKKSNRRGRRMPKRNKVNDFLPENKEVTNRITSKGKNIYDNTIHPFTAHQLCCEHGFTRAQVARAFGVSLKTVEAWVTKYPDFKNAMIEGRDAFDSQNVEQMLLKRAMGFEYEEVSTKTVKLRGKSADGDVIFVPAKETTRTIKYVPPETKAITFWLTNRHKERWQLVHKIEGKMKKITEHTELNTSGTDLSKMSIEQLKVLRDMVTQSAGDNGAAIPVECLTDGPVSEEVLMIDNIMEAAYDIIEEESA